MYKLAALALAAILWSIPAQAQNPTCPTRPAGDNSNACASTAFVQGAVSGGSLPQNANTVFAGPTSGSAAPPTFRKLVPADIPTNIRAVTPQDFEAVCDGVADDTIPLQNWLASLGTVSVSGLTNAGYVPGGTCIYKQPLIAPHVNAITIFGDGLSSQLRYAGVSTTITGLVIGQTNGGCSSNGVTIHNLLLSSATKMTAGSAVEMDDACGVRMYNTGIEDNAGGGFGNWFQGIVAKGGNQVYLTDNTVTGSNVPVIAYGDGSPQTITISIASPAVVTFPGIAAANGVAIKLATTGALPTGLTAGTLYYIINSSGSTAQLSTTPNGSAVNTSGTQSGTQTISLQTQLTDIRINGGIYLGGIIGVDLAGNVGGGVIDNTDILGNQTELKISQDFVSIPNSQVFLGPTLFLDATSGGLGRGVDLEDPGGNNSILTLNGTWVASSGMDCFHIASGVQWVVNWTGGWLANCGADGLSQGSTSTVVSIKDVTVDMTLGGFAGSTGYAFDCLVSNNNVWFKNVDLISWGLSGQFSSACQPQAFTSNSSPAQFSQVIAANNLFPLNGWQYDVSAQNVVTIANAANAALTAGSGQVVVSNGATGDTGTYLCGGGACVLQGTSTQGNWVASTTTPASGKSSVAYDGSTNYRIYNNTGASVNYNVSLTRLRNSN